MKISPTEFEVENVARYTAMFRSEETAFLFVKATSDHLRLYEDITTGQIALESNLLSLVSILAGNNHFTSWKDYASSFQKKRVSPKGCKSRPTSI